MISPSITWKPDDATKFTILANYTHLDLTHNGGIFLPCYGTVVDAPFGKIDRKANFTEPSIDDYNRDQAAIGYELEQTFDNDWTVRQNLRYGGGGVSYVGSSYADQLNTLKVPDVALVDLKLGYRKNNWGVDLNVTNLFDEDYVSGCQGVYVCSYGEGRKALLKAHLTW
ncbi:TonB-dependent receptor [Phyllobacterium bourgognense]|uniref:TonB-dependent receptor-like protein n=1 Tax=Phyllobacterium bourgognense TaxID=314236 RepID=A0A368YQL2_9HYPH|nr:TonB-dependent receptor [Phyllobacterium bourgognense]RCW81556.1 TonB-dependent receptor-like protein [Phyllobacterium bourgognense]